MFHSQSLSPVLLPCTSDLNLKSVCGAAYVHGSVLETCRVLFAVVGLFCGVTNACPTASVEQGLTTE